MRKKKKRVSVYVSKRNIERGTKGSLCDCPVALALKETFNTSRAFVDGVDLWVRSEPWLAPSMSWSTPPVVARFIKRFDKGKSVRPFSFSLYV